MKKKGKRKGTEVSTVKDRAVESFVFWIVERKKKKKKRERSEGKIDRKGDRGRIRSDWGKNEDTRRAVRSSRWHRGE